MWKKSFIFCSISHIEPSVFSMYMYFSTCSAALSGIPDWGRDRNGRKDQEGRTGLLSNIIKLCCNPVVDITTTPESIQCYIQSGLSHCSWCWQLFCQWWHHNNWEQSAGACEHWYIVAQNDLRYPVQVLYFLLINWQCVSCVFRSIRN